MFKPINWFAIGNCTQGMGLGSIAFALGWLEASVAVGIAMIVIGLALEYGPGQRIKLVHSQN